MMEENFSEDINKAVATLKKGGIILYPTDTIWGIGCDARNPEAVKKIYSLKQREDSKSMLILVNNIAALERIVDDIPEITFDLLEAAVHPLTIIYDNATGVASGLLAEDGSLGIRITKEKFSSELCRRLGAPIVSTSANVSGNPSPKNFDEIDEEIKKQMDYVVKYRQDDKRASTPSNIIKLTKGGVIKIIR